METNKKLIIAFIIIIIAGVGIFGYMHQNSHSKIELGKTTFKLPDGYKEGEWTKNNTVRVSDGKTAAFISLKGNDNLNKTVYGFAQGFEKTGNHTIITNFTTSNVFVYKLNIENDTASYYWFKNNGETYCVYTWEANNNIETLVVDLIKSME